MPLLLAGCSKSYTAEKAVAAVAVAVAMIAAVVAAATMVALAVVGPHLQEERWPGEQKEESEQQQ